MKRISPHFVIYLMLVFILAACSPGGAPAQPSPEPAQPLSLADGLGRTVTLEQPAQRIVSMAPSITETLFYVGAGAQVVGRDEFTNYPPEALDLPTIGGSMGEYNYEQILSLNPDLVIAAEINTPEQVKALEDLGVTVFYLANPTDMEGLYSMLVTVGELSGRKSEAESLAAALRERVTALEARLSAVEQPVTVFYELDGSDPAKPWTVGPGNFIDLLITKAGGENVGAALDMPWGQLSLEALLLADPHIILLGDANYGMTVEQVTGRAGWGDLTAVQEGRIYPFDDDLVSRPGARMVDGLEQMARLFHPQLFE